MYLTHRPYSTTGRREGLRFYSVSDIDLFHATMRGVRIKLRLQSSSLRTGNRIESKNALESEDSGSMGYSGYLPSSKGRRNSQENDSGG